MPDPTEPARSYLAEAMIFLSAKGIDVSFDRVEGAIRFYVDGESVTEGDLVAKAVALGMLDNAKQLQ